MNNKKKWQTYLIVILVIGTLLRFGMALAASPAGDACWHLTVARFIGTEQIIPVYEQLGRNEPFWPSPLFHIVSAVFYNIGEYLFKEGDLFARMLAPLAGSISLWLVYTIVKELTNNKKAVLATGFVSFLPLHMYYSTISYIDGFLFFMICLATYLIIKQKRIVNGIITGLILLSKFTGVFFLPPAIYLWSKSKKKTVKKWFLPLIISIGSLWYIRNLIVFGNPVYPFLEKVFGGPVLESALPSGSIMNLFSIKHVITTYLGIFGVPNGQFENLYAVTIPFQNTIIIGWLFITIIALFPIVKGWKKYKWNESKHKALALLFVAFFISILIYMFNTNLAYARLFILPSLLFFATLWGYGMNELLKSKKKIALLFILIAIIFSAGEITKTVVAADRWNDLSEDFNWIKKNTDKEATIFGSGQCVQYYTNRKAKTLDKLESAKDSDVIMIADIHNFSPLPENVVLDKNKVTLIYKGTRTGFKLYKVR